MTQEDNLRFSKALAFASIKHSKQQRKDGTPYIMHPIRVANYLAKEGKDVRYQIVGLFHDLLEDTDATEEELLEFCDLEMLEAVKLLTKYKGFVEEEYINNILVNPIAKAVKNADRIDNLSDLICLNDCKFKDRYLKNTKDYFFDKFSKELDSVYIKVNGGI